MTKFRDGDLVSVLARVRFADTEENERVILDIQTSYNRDDITLVCPALHANEEVTITNANSGSSETALVRGAHGKHAWLELNDGQMITINAIDVHRKQ
ncbi:hypothetical protein EHS39_32910 [Ensifer sp. MPMI2T]|nr:hypothetical protein EHS39_32910 [Ensifer sp. MPMI2T]